MSSVLSRTSAILLRFGLQSQNGRQLALNFLDFPREFSLYIEQDGKIQNQQSQAAKVNRTIGNGFIPFSNMVVLVDLPPGDSIVYVLRPSIGKNSVKFVSLLPSMPRTKTPSH